MISFSEVRLSSACTSCIYSSWSLQVLAPHRRGRHNSVGRKSWQEYLHLIFHVHLVTLAMHITITLPKTPSYHLDHLHHLVTLTILY